jgi:Reverse transcriptase (RNA-dependent DNA polymerase).
MQKEIDDQMENGNFEIIKRREVPKVATILPPVWQMKQKRDILSRQVKKWKARLNVDGSRMKKGIHYDQTYAPVASWNSIRTLLALTAIHNWHTIQLDYVLAFPQAPVEKEIYMEIPQGVKLPDGDDTKDYVLKLKHSNVYGQKQAGQVWNKYLVDKLVNEVGFKQSEVDMSFNQFWQSMCFFCGILLPNHIRSSTVGPLSGPAKLLQIFYPYLMSAEALQKYLVIFG